MVEREPTISKVVGQEVVMEESEDAKEEGGEGSKVSRGERSRQDLQGLQQTRKGYRPSLPCLGLRHRGIAK